MTRRHEKELDMKWDTRKRWAVVAMGSAVTLLVGAVGGALASPPTAAAGVFTQTTVTGFDVRSAGPNTILDTTIEGSVSGTLTGTVEYRITVVIHPNGSFSAHGATMCQCTFKGKEGQLQFLVTDTGQQVSQNTGLFAGRAVITEATGELFGLRGNLGIQGTVDITTGLSTINYSGEIHFHD
jgi:hypothetical protein